MKKILFIFTCILSIFSIVNCEENIEKLNPDDILGPQEETDGISNITIPKPAFPIVAIVDGVSKNFISINGTDKANSFNSGELSQIVFSSQEQENSDSKLMITISISRSDISLGEKELSLLGNTRIDVSDSTKLLDGVTLLSSGKRLIIEQLDTTQGIIAGSFEIDVNETQTNSGAITNSFKITNGKFYFTYEVK